MLEIDLLRRSFFGTRRSHSAETNVVLFEDLLDEHYWLHEDN